MRSRYPSSSTLAYSFGPGPLTPAIKAIIAANVAAFLISLVVPAITLTFGLRPADIFGRLHIWQPITYMFLHAGIFHILFNMLALWMFGVELERTWGSRYFLQYYFICGVGAAMTTMLLSFVPGAFGEQLYYSLTIGASGAVYGILLAYALYFPSRSIPQKINRPEGARREVKVQHHQERDDRRHARPEAQDQREPRGKLTDRHETREEWHAGNADGLEIPAHDWRRLRQEDHLKLLQQDVAVGQPRNLR